jgi:hypothetical protein
LHGGYAQRTAECIARHEGHHEISEFLCYHEKRPSAARARVETRRGRLSRRRSTLSPGQD